MAVYVKRKLISGNLDNFQITEKTLLTDLAQRSNIPLVLFDHINLTIDGVLIEHDKWSSTYADVHNVVFISLVPRGGGGEGGKNPLAAIAAIALSVFAPYAAGTLMGLTGTTATIAQAGIMFVGSMLISAIFPPPKSLSRNSGDDSSGFFGFEGVKNQARPHQAVRNVFGEYKVAPDLAVEPYITTAGDNQTIHTIYDFGYGDIDLSQLEIGSTPLDRYSNLNYKIHKNYTNGALSYYANDNVTEQFSVEIKNAWIFRKTLSDSANSATINISFPTGLVWIHERRGNEPNTASFQLMYRKSGGSWIHFSQGPFFRTSHRVTYDSASSYPSSITIVNLYSHPSPAYNGTTYSVVNGGTNYIFQTRSVTRAGLSPIGQAPAPRVGTKFTRNGVVHTITSVSGSISNVWVLASRIYHDWSDTTSSTYYTNSQFNVVISPAIVGGERIPDVFVASQDCNFPDGYCVNTSGWAARTGATSFSVSRPPNTVFHLTRTTAIPFVFSCDVGFPSDEEWEIAIRRSDPVLYPQNADFDDQYYDRTDLVAITAKSYVKPLDFDVPHTILEMSVRSTNQLSGVIDTLTAMSRRKLKTFDGGTEEYKQTSNPAWLVYEVMTGIANSDPIPENRIDLQSFIDWAAFCDVISVHGDNKYQCAMNMDTSSTVKDRVDSIMASGRATLTMRDNKYAVIFEDFPTIPRQLFTNQNSWDFSGVKVFINHPHALRCSFKDPASEWQMTDLIVYNDGYDVNNATYFEDLSMPLVTRSNQAWRDGRYFLAQSKLRPESFTLTTDIENLTCERGSLIEHQNDIARSGGIATRIVGISGNDVTLHQPVVFDVSESYFMRLRYNDGTQEEIAVTNVTDDFVVTLASTPVNANNGDLIVFGINDFVTEQFLVKSISPGSDLSATLELVPIAREIANADTGPIPDYIPNIRNDDMLTPQCVIGLTSEQTLYYDQRSPYVDTAISWQDMGANVRYEVWIAYNDSHDYELNDSVLAGITTYTIFNKKSTLDDDYNYGTSMRVKVLPINIFGYKADIDSCIEILIELLYDKEAPDKPKFFAGNITDQTIALTWLPPVAKDLGGYILKFYPHLTQEHWLKGTVESNIIPFNSTAININARLGTYMLKAVDTTGNLSVDYAVVRTTVPDLSNLSGLVTSDQNPDFLGSKTNVEYTNGLLSLTEIDGAYSKIGTYNFDSVVDLGSIQRVFISSSAVISAIDNVMIDTWDLLSNVPFMTEVKDGDLNAVIQVRMVNVKEFLSTWPVLSSVGIIGNATNQKWSGWQTLTAGFYTGRYFQMRVVLTSRVTYASPAVKDLSVAFLLRERSEADNDIICPIGGTSILFDKEFSSTKKPIIGITEDNSSTGNYYNLTSIAATGFNIEFFDSSDTSIAAQFDYTVNGVGEVLPDNYSPLNQYEEDSIEVLNASIVAVNNLLI